MKWLRLTFLVPILLLCVSQNATRAQSPAEPIKAKQRSLTYQIQPDGSRVLKGERAGAFYRSSSGATMNTVGDQSTFTDEQGNTYEIVHSKKFAKFVMRSPQPWHEQIKKTRPESIKGHETVSGLDCAVRTVLVNGKPAGKEYLYLPYGLWVKAEWMEPGGGSHLMVRELYDIEVAEPGPELVRIPEGYSIDNQPE